MAMDAVKLRKGDGVVNGGDSMRGHNYLPESRLFSLDVCRDGTKSLAIIALVRVAITNESVNA
jgi:hypothetical protein